MPKRRDFLVALSALGLDSTAAAPPDQSTIYIPARQVEASRDVILDFMEEFSFVMLVTAKGGVHVTNVPTLFDRAPAGWGKLWWHMAKGNAQSGLLDGGTECTVVFRGPHAYISPNWYNAKTAVPTWNFAVVHATGRPKRVEDDAAFAKSLERLVAHNEGAYGGGAWDYAKLPESYLKGMRQGIVAYEMVIDQVEAKFKLGQERSAADRATVLKGLRTGRKERGIAEFTEAYYGRSKG
ncbi:MAG TPA: FMN-binding negative transcriptional regulator [Paludibaculum sp.]|jgi:transcriptional regulator